MNEVQLLLHLVPQRLDYLSLWILEQYHQVHIGDIEGDYYFRVCITILNRFLIDGKYRSTSISNVTFSGAPLSRRSSERELSDGPKKRATSAGGLDRQVDGNNILFSLNTLEHKFHLISLC